MNIQRARTRFNDSIGKPHWLVEMCRSKRLRILPRMFKFTRATIENLPYVEPSVEDGKRRQQRFHWDELDHKLLLVVGMNTKTLYAEGNPRVKLGLFGDITVDQARRDAERIRVEQRQGINHNEQRRKERDAKQAEKAITLGAVFEDMIAARVQSQRLKKQSTVKQYRSLINYNFADWLDKPLTKITGPLIKRRIVAIRQRALNSGRKRAR